MKSKVTISIALSADTLLKLKCAEFLTNLKSRAAIIDELVDSYLVELVKVYIEKRELGPEALHAYISKNLGDCLNISTEAAIRLHTKLVDE